MLTPDDLISKGVFILGDAQSFLGQTSKIPPFTSMLKFDADVKNTSARHQCENRFMLNFVSKGFNVQF